MVLAQLTTTDWKIGTKWTYELVEEDRFFGPFVQEIIDTATVAGKHCIILARDGSLYDTIAIDDNRVYTWSEPLNTFLIGYDFNQYSSYHTTLYPYQDSLPALIKASSMITIPSGQTVERQEVSIFGLYGTSRTALYRHIGPDLDVLPPTTDLIFITGVYVSKLRCWEHNGEMYNFTDQPCDTTYTITSTEEIDADMVRIYPNPVSDLLMIDCADCASGDAVLYNIRTQEAILSQKLIGNGQHQIPLNGIPSGTYTVVITAANGAYQEQVIKISH